MPNYATELKVRFGDIDHAGIVYYPRISHYCHVAFEEFFSDRIGIPYHSVLDDRRPVNHASGCQPVAGVRWSSDHPSRLAEIGLPGVHQCR